MPATLLNLRKSYFHPESGEKREVLKGVSLEIAEGDSSAIVGPSGSGKSTLLHLMGLLDTADEGDYILNGKHPFLLEERPRAAVRNREIGFVFQLHYLLPQYTVLENVLLPSIPRFPGGDRGVRERARYLLERVGLKDFAEARPGELSGGEQQRVAVVRALINSPSLILADEPTGSLDHETALRVVRLLTELTGEGKAALVMVTHAPEIAAVTDRIFSLRDGVLVAEPGGGRPES